MCYKKSRRSEVAACPGTLLFVLPERCLKAAKSASKGKQFGQAPIERPRDGNKVAALDSAVDTPAKYSLRSEDIHLVDSYTSLEAMQGHIFPAEDIQTAQDGRPQPEVAQSDGLVPESSQNGSSASPATGPIATSDDLSSTSAGASPVLDSYTGVQILENSDNRHTYKMVGMDAEWQPLDRFSPVTVLQISTRSRAFLIDMIWFCRPAPLGWRSSGDFPLTSVVP